MPYFKIQIHLNDKHANLLANGKKISINHKHQSGEGMLPDKAELYLTKAQIKRISSALKQCKKSDLTLSNKQLHHIAQTGSGWFSNLVKSVISTVQKIHHHVKPHAKKVLDHVLPIIEPVFNELKTQAISSGKDLGNTALQRGVDYSKRGIQDIHRLAKVELTRGQKADGFFDDLYSGLKSVATPILNNVVIPAATAALTKRLSGGQMQQRQRQRNSSGRFVSSKKQSGEALYL